jgi:hypothetical protein
MPGHRRAPGEAEGPAARRRVQKAELVRQFPLFADMDDALLQAS